MTLEKVLYTGKTHTKGGRHGEARSSDGRLDIKLSDANYDRSPIVQSVRLRAEPNFGQP